MVKFTLIVHLLNPIHPKHYNFNMGSKTMTSDSFLHEVLETHGLLHTQPKPALSSSLGRSPRRVPSPLSTFICVKFGSFNSFSLPTKGLGSRYLYLWAKAFFLVRFLEIGYKYALKPQQINLGNVFSYENSDFRCMPTAAQDGERLLCLTFSPL